MKSKEQILKESMSKPYCSGTRFDFLDEEEKEMIYEAMGKYLDQFKDKSLPIIEGSMKSNIKKL